MKKITHLTIRLVISATLLIILAGVASADGSYSGGTGEPNNPYQISITADMTEIGTHPEDWDSCFVLTADINLIDYNETNFNTIGNDETEFTGIFDGSGHTISNFSWNSAGSDYVGLFGCIDDPNAVIKNLRLLEPDVRGDDNVGALVGILRHGTITGCGIEGGAVAGDLYVGGMVGGSNGAISSCCTTCSVSGNSDLGGLAGYNNGDIENCYATGPVSGTNSYVGGLLGYNDDGTILNCYAAGPVSSINYVGGLTGNNYGICSVSFWDKDTSGRSNGIGLGGSLGITGKTTSQMKSIITFLGWGNEPAVWTIDDTNDYPRLAWENLPAEPISPIISDLLEGSGTKANPYLIYNPNDLDLMGLFSNDRNKYFKLAADIDFSNFSINEPNLIASFAGVFDGNGHSISNFTCLTPQDRYIGLFRQINGPNALIKDLTIIEPNVQADYYVGCLAGCLRNGTITRCSIQDGSVSGNDDTGCLVGRNSGTVSNSYTTGSVSGGSSLGGLTGYNNGVILNCNAAVSITATDDYIGGLVGYNYYGTISNSCSAGNVTGNLHIGGLIGFSGYSAISNCYALGNVTGNSRVGGLSGHNSHSTISNCYVTGSVTVTNGTVGGLTGLNSYTDILASFWDIQTTDQNDAIGINYGTGTVETYGQTSAQMKIQATYTDRGWDFIGEITNGSNDIWRMCIDASNYPKLWWEFVTGDLNCPDGVDFADFAVFSLAWLSEDGQPKWNYRCNISDSSDNRIDEYDLEVFTDNWLAGK